MNRTNTKSQILDAAEQLIGELGYDAMSLRALTAEAGVNLAAVHYHFGSKEGLLRALLERRFTPLNAERLRRLNAAEQASAPDPAPVREVVAAVVEPVLEAIHDDAQQFRHFIRLVGRCHFESSAVLEPMFRDIMGELIKRTESALSRALSHLPAEELALRMHFSLGAFAHTLARGNEMCGEIAASGDLDVGASLVRFMTAGLEAPYPQDSNKR